MTATYEIFQRENTSYQFTTENNIKYDIILEDISLNYQTAKGEKRTIYEISLKGITNAPRDLKTGLTIIKFLRDFFSKKENDAIMYRVHNKMEALANNRRRGDIRKILFNRLMRHHGNGYIELTNNTFHPPVDDELFCIVIDVNTPNYKKIVANFYQFCNLNT